MDFILFLRCVNCLCNVGKSGLVLPPTSVTVTKFLETRCLQGFETTKRLSHEFLTSVTGDKKETIWKMMLGVVSGWLL